MRRLQVEGLEDRKLLSVTSPMLPASAPDGDLASPSAMPYEEVGAITSPIELPPAELLAESDPAAPAENAPSTAQDDAFSITSHQQLGSGVLVNDGNPDAGPLAVALQSDVSHGTLVLQSNGLFTYKPNDGFVGTDSFTYVVNNGQNAFSYQAFDAHGSSNVATVSITVEPAGNAPVGADDSYAINEDETLVVEASGVLANDADVDGDPLTAILVDGPAHGLLTLAKDGSFEYTPNPDFHGSDGFTYLPNDGQLDGNLATVSITVEPVNDAPVGADDSYAINEDETLIVDASGVLANDSDVDGDPLAAILVDGPAHGMLTLAKDGSFEYAPNPDFHGSDGFTYLPNDGQLDGNLATVSITVEPVNDAPVGADDGYSVSEDETLIVEASGVLANDVDMEGDPLAAILVDGPAHGTVKLGDDGSVEYAPNPDFYGSDGFTYLPNDGQLDGSLATVSITVEPVNDAPVGADDGYSVNEDQTLIVEASGVLANDTDVDGDPLTAVLVDGPAHGTVKLGDDGSVEYAPNPDFYGSDGFTYLPNDGQLDGSLAAVIITVEPINDAPAGVDDSYSVTEDETLIVEASGVLANDADVEGDPLTAILVDGPAHGMLTLAKDGSFEFAPNADFHGSDGFTYLPNDGQLDGNLATVSIIVEPVNSELAIELNVSGTAFGPDAGATWAGSTFWVNAYVKDLRDMPQGVVGGAVDVLFDSLWVTPTGGVAYGEDFTAFQQGTPDDTAGWIDEAGALTTEGGVGTDAAAPFVAWQFVRNDAAVGGPVQFAVEPGEGTATITPANFALVGSGDPVDWALVELGTADLELTLPDLNGDELVNHFDLALWQPHSGSAVGDLSYDPACDFTGDGLINQGDLDLLMDAMYQPIEPEPVALQAITESDLSQDGDGTEDSPTGPRGWRGPDRHGFRWHAKLRAADRLFAERLFWW